MKWFKHYSDAHTNLKLRQVIVEHGMEAFGFWWLVLEFIAQQGTGFKIKSNKNWRKNLEYDSKLSKEIIEKYLLFFSEVKLLNGKSLKNGDLHIPKLDDYGDEYSKRLPIHSRYTPDSVVLDKIRIDKIRIDKNMATAPKKNFKYLLGVPKEDLEELSDKYKISHKGIQNKAVDLSLWCQSKGRVMKNYRAFLENALRKDQIKLRTEFPLPRKATVTTDEEITDEDRKYGAQKVREMRDSLTKKLTIN